MLIAALIAMNLLTAGIAPVPPARPVPETFSWHDEFDNLGWWTLPGSQNDPVVSVDTPGVMTLTMPQAPIGYPHSYQWGAISRTFAVNTETSPLLVASVTRLSDGGYAHLDVEMRDYNGKVVKGARSNTLQGKGLAAVNLRDEFGTGLLRITVRLIIGGPNSGAWCDYDFLRAMRPEQFTTLQNTLNKPVAKVEPRASRTR